MRSIFYVGRRQFCRRDFEILAEHVHLQNLGNPLFPYGTLAVNCLGCLAIGFVAGLAETRSIFTANDRLFIFVGVLGGFTTLSSVA
jgi:fluoride exporter